MSQHTEGKHARTVSASTDIYTILSNPRRQLALSVIYEHGPEPLPVKELATAVAKRETDDTVSESHEQSVYVSLHQTHLPKLAEHDIIEYDTDAKRVSLKTTDHPVFAHLTADSDSVLSSSTTVIITGGTGAVAAILGLADMMDPLWIGVGVYVVLTVLIFAQTAPEAVPGRNHR